MGLDTSITGLVYIEYSHPLLHCCDDVTSQRIEVKSNGTGRCTLALWRVDVPLKGKFAAGRRGLGGGRLEVDRIRRACVLLETTQI